MKQRSVSVPPLTIELMQLHDNFNELGWVGLDGMPTTYPVTCVTSDVIECNYKKHTNCCGEAKRCTAQLEPIAADICQDDRSTLRSLREPEPKICSRPEATSDLASSTGVVKRDRKEVGKDVLVKKNW